MSRTRDLVKLIDDLNEDERGSRRRKNSTAQELLSPIFDELFDACPEIIKVRLTAQKQFKYWLYDPKNIPGPRVQEIYAAVAAFKATYLDDVPVDFFQEFIGEDEEFVVDRNREIE